MQHSTPMQEAGLSYSELVIIKVEYGNMTSTVRIPKLSLDCPICAKGLGNALGALILSHSEFGELTFMRLATSPHCTPDHTPYLFVESTVRSAILSEQWDGIGRPRQEPSPNPLWMGGCLDMKAEVNHLVSSTKCTTRD